ncbi:MAG TPA: hypothetical protein VK509_16660, partial [Polyangiales bacterium]|nr:hypothetical protein [Polyangiales bacterium]
STVISAEKADGTSVLVGTASIGPDHGVTELGDRMARLRPSGPLVILRDLKVGQKGAGNPEPVVMGFDESMGKLYPFSLNDKLRMITESSPWYTREGGATSPWGRAVIPLEMISVLAQYTSDHAGFRARGPAVGLFAALEIKLIKGPLFVDQPYLLEREIIALSQSKRTESNWVKTSVLDASTRELVAEVILNSATMKDSYARYAEEAKALGL